MRASAFPGEDPLTPKAPEEIMNTYLFLMGKDSVEINGESINCQNKKH